MALIAVPVLVFQPEGLHRMRGLQAELAQVERENEQLQRDIATRKDEVKSLRENPREVERIAREQLGLVRKSEVVFQFRRNR
jgi:cell division protein FtsB